VLRTTSTLLALTCLILCASIGPAVGQANVPATEVIPTTPATGATTQPLQPIVLEEIVPPLEPGMQPEHPEEVEEPVEPPTAAERFAELKRFGMNVFGPTEATETTATGAEPGADEDESGAEKPTAERTQQPAAQAPARPRAVLASEPVPPTYVLGPGDQLAVRVWTDAIEHVAATPIIDADGRIYLDLLGEVTVGGERLSGAREMITRRYHEFFNRAQVSVGLSRTRVIEVRVTGDVRRPGTHLLSGAATLFSALNAAGGPNDVGSFRAIRVVRRGEEPLVVDLYDYLLRGEIDADVPLEPNDTIFVPPLPAEFGVDGEVRRPARYEMTGPVTLAEALQMAAGVTATGYMQGAELWRVGESGTRELLNVNLRTADADLRLQSGDLVVIPPVLEKPLNVVRLEGAVRRPGAYQVSAGMTVRDLLDLAGGPAENAHTEEAVIERLGEDLDRDLIHFDLAAALAGEPARARSANPTRIRGCAAHASRTS